MNPAGRGRWSLNEPWISSTAVKDPRIVPSQGARHLLDPIVWEAGELVALVTAGAAMRSVPECSRPSSTQPLRDGPSIELRAADDPNLSSAVEPNRVHSYGGLPA